MHFISFHYADRIANIRHCAAFIDVFRCLLYVLRRFDDTSLSTAFARPIFSPPFSYAISTALIDYAAASFAALFAIMPADCFHFLDVHFARQLMLPMFSFAMPPLFSLLLPPITCFRFRAPPMPLHAALRVISSAFDISPRAILMFLSGCSVFFGFFADAFRRRHFRQRDASLRCLTPPAAMLSPADAISAMPR